MACAPSAIFQPTDFSACHLPVDPASSWLSIPRSKPPNVAANPIGKCIVSYDNNVSAFPRALFEKLKLPVATVLSATKF